MMRLKWPRIAGLVLAAGWFAPAQTHYPVFAPDDFVSAMKTLGRNFNAVNALIAKSDFETAKPQLARSRELLATTAPFWKDRHKDDGTKLLHNALNRLDDLDAALSAEKVDAAAAGASAKEAAAACQACHAVYREKVPETAAYRFKKGLVP